MLIKTIEYEFHDDEFENFSMESVGTSEQDTDDIVKIIDKHYLAENKLIRGMRRFLKGEKKIFHETLGNKNSNFKTTKSKNFIYHPSKDSLLIEGTNGEDDYHVTFEGTDERGTKAIFEIEDKLTVEYFGNSEKNLQDMKDKLN